jgi:phosphoribosylanthranilate isomerase
MRTRIKFCGITNRKDAMYAAELGADAIGLVFYAQSPRAISPEQAREICRLLPPFIVRVGLFVDAPVAEIQEVIRQVPLDRVQYHGDEDPAICAQTQLPYIKALRVSADADLAAMMKRYADASAILLDTHHAQLKGGTGERFDWTRIPVQHPRPLILAGGLTPANVAAAVRAIGPYGVDVSSGVEVRPGVKDPIKMAAFAREVFDADIHSKSS